MEWLLLPFSLAYRTGNWLRNIPFEAGWRKPYRAALPVISVGNISFGGSEKTSLVMYLISLCLSRGHNPALITRGYKGEWEKKGGILSDGRKILGTWQEGGDEPFMVALNFPKAGVYVGRNRKISSERAARDGFDVAILDDGFQVRVLKKDLDILLYSPKDRVLLREFRGAIRRADCVLVREEEEEKAREDVKRYAPSGRVFPYRVSLAGFSRLKDDRAVSKQDLFGKRIILVSGIARPERVRLLMEKEGLAPAGFLTFPDHHGYPASSLKRISEEAQKTGAQAVLTTEKDAIKLQGLEDESNIPVFYSKIRLVPDQGFDEEIVSVLDAR